MIVSKLIKELNKLPQDLNIKIVDTSGFKSDFNILNGSIQLPVRIVEYETVKTGHIDQNTPFLNDVGMMCDLIAMTKDSFLKGVKVLFNGVDVTAGVAIELDAEMLEVTKAKRYYTSESASVPFIEGEVLTANGITKSGQKLPNGYYEEFEFTGSLSEIGETENTFTVKIYSGTGDDKVDQTSNFEIYCTYGVLKLYEEI